MCCLFVSVYVCVSVSVTVSVSLCLCLCRSLFLSYICFYFKFCHHLSFWCPNNCKQLSKLINKNCVDVCIVICILKFTSSHKTHTYLFFSVLHSDQAGSSTTERFHSPAHTTAVRGPTSIHRNLTSDHEGSAGGKQSHWQHRNCISLSGSQHR